MNITPFYIAAAAVLCLSLPAHASYESLAAAAKTGKKDRITDEIFRVLDSWSDNRIEQGAFNPSLYKEDARITLSNCPKGDQECVTTVVDAFKMRGVRLNLGDLQNITKGLGIDYTKEELELLSFPWEWGAKTEITKLAMAGNAEDVGNYVITQLHFTEEGWKKTILSEAMKACETAECFTAIADSATGIDAAFTLTELKQALAGSKLKDAAKIALNDNALSLHVVDLRTIRIVRAAGVGDSSNLVAVITREMSGVRPDAKRLLSKAMAACTTTSCFTEIASAAGTYGLTFSEDDLTRLVASSGLEFSEEELVAMGIGAVSEQLQNNGARARVGVGGSQTASGDAPVSLESSANSTGDSSGRSGSPS